MDFTSFSSPLNISPQSEAKRLSKELENLKSKTNGELQELLERHSNILSKPHLIAGLPDKGQKLQLLKDRIEAELTARSSPACVDNVINAMSSVQLSDTLEWNVAESGPVPISAEASQDPLYNFLQNTEANKDSNYDPYVQSLCKKYGSPQDGEMQMNQRFMPFRSTESSPKSIAEKKASHASPNAHLTKQLPLSESLELLKTQAQTVAQKSSSSLMNVWRQRATVGSDTEEEEEEEAEQLEVQKDEEEEGDPPQVPDDE